MIRVIAFDLDGVLLDTKDVHLRMLNEALLENGVLFQLTELENKTILNEQPTMQKLIYLNSRGLDPNLNDRIMLTKREKTLRWIASHAATTEPRLRNLFTSLRQQQIKIAIVTNASRQNVEMFLETTSLASFVDVIVTNSDVCPKPAPDGYLKVSNDLNVDVREILVLEDSTPGLEAAGNAGCFRAFVTSSLELDVDYVNELLCDINAGVYSTTSFIVPNMFIVVPMAGEGSRFKNDGWCVPKPFIEIDGKPMYATVLHNLGLQSKTILLTRTWDHIRVNSIINKHTPTAKVVNVEKLTDGAASTVLLAKPLFNKRDSILVVNSDNIVKFDFVDMIQVCRSKDAAGAIVTFLDNDPKWSFAKINADGYVLEVAEKNQISNIATAGVYFWKYACDFVTDAESMIAKDIRVNNEFYLCPVYNQTISAGKRIITVQAKKFHSLGTPEDLANYFSGHETYCTSR